jgi:hypothetical protein
MLGFRNRSRHPHLSATLIPFPTQVNSLKRQLRNGDFQTWHGHLAREKRAIFHEMPQEITGKMPVPRYFATPSLKQFSILDLGSENAGKEP